MAQTTLNTIIDINGLIDFYKDDLNPEWGTIEIPCNADPFYKLMSSHCNFIGQDLKIPILEPKSEYVWRLQYLDEEYPLVKGDVSPEVNIILEKSPQQIAWDKIFILNEHFSEDDKGRLLVSETSTHSFIFKTQSDIKKNMNLSYSIKFSFFGGDKIRYGKIDPFIIVRSDDVPDEKKQKDNSSS
jgi:hypothetical protein